MTRPIRRIAILGSGIEAVLAEFVLTQRTGLEVARYSESNTPAFSAAHSVLTPQALQQLEHAGLILRDLLGLPGSLPTLGTRLSKKGQTRWRPFGPCGLDWAGTGFHHHWLRARHGGLTVPYAAFSPAYRAMQENRFAPPDRRNRIGALQHESGLHVHPAALFDRLAQARQAHPIHPGLDVDADLIIDAREVTPGLERAETGIVQPCSEWTCEVGELHVSIPLRGETLEQRIAPASPTTSILPPWTGNRVSIGQAAHAGPCLPGLAVERLLFELDLLIELMPDAACDPAETLEYNRIWIEEMKEVDALVSLYLDVENPRASERLQMFQHRGYVRSLDTSLVTESDWISHAMALGHITRHHDPLSHRLDDSRLKLELGQLLQKVNTVSGEFPPFAVYLEAIDKALGRAEETA